MRSTGLRPKKSSPGFGTFGGRILRRGRGVLLMDVSMEEPGREQRDWYLARDGREYGPITQSELNALQAMGELRSDDLLWCDGG